MRKKSLIIWSLYLLIVVCYFLSFSFYIVNTYKPLAEKKDFSLDALPNLVEVINLKSDTRPYAVMINNFDVARENHAGLTDAYLVYEIIVEGGITRLMALFKDKTTSRIGSVRSARPYFLDYALENDAIFVHHGYSPQAKDDIKNLQVDNLNGLYDAAFFRDTSLPVAYEHTSFTNMDLIINNAISKNYRLTTNKPIPFSFSHFNQDLSNKEGARVANNVAITYSASLVTSYAYDEKTGLYLRYVNGSEHKDALTGEQYKATNIITYQVKNETIADGTNTGRQSLDNIGSGEGYFITRGKAVKITWEKPSREAKTVYRYLDGSEVILNDGVTYIQIQPSNEQLIITN